MALLLRDGTEVERPTEAEVDAAWAVIARNVLAQAVEEADEGETTWSQALLLEREEASNLLDDLKVAIVELTGEEIEDAEDETTPGAPELGHDDQEEWD